MELFTEAATDQEFAAITGYVPGDLQKKQVREQLEKNPESNAECMAWLYTMRGDSAKVSETLRTLPKERADELAQKFAMVAPDIQLIREEAQKNITRQQEPEEK